MSSSFRPTSTTTVAVAVAAAAVSSTILFHAYYRRKTNSNKCEIPGKLKESPYVKELELACKLAYEAGTNMNRYIKSNTACENDEADGNNPALTLKIDQKTNAADFCTQVDVENEHLIAEGIRRAFPDHQIIGEEGVGTGEVPKLQPGNKTWIIDPIDGTTNFSMSLAMTCVSIGFCDEKGKPVMGVIFAPATDDWYMAVSNYGAFWNGKRILPDKRRVKKGISEAVLCCELGYSRKTEEIDVMLGGMKRILANGCRALRGFGSGCLDICYVATGQLDIVYAGLANEGWKPWDYAAGLVICTEAGCVMESIDQKTPGEFDLYSKSILCGGSRELVDECRKLLLP